jgi:hypothetical protein
VDVETILATPVRDELEDFHAWQYDSKGNISIKSAYKLYVRIQDGSQPSSSSQNRQHTILEIYLESIPNLPRVQHFIWRLAHNSLPQSKKKEYTSHRAVVLNLTFLRTFTSCGNPFLKVNQSLCPNSYLRYIQA